MAESCFGILVIVAESRFGIPVIDEACDSGFVFSGSLGLSWILGLCWVLWASGPLLGSGVPLGLLRFVERSGCSYAVAVASLPGLLGLCGAWSVANHIAPRVSLRVFLGLNFDRVACKRIPSCFIDLWPFKLTAL